MDGPNDETPTNPYMALRAAKIARNQARLKELGLFKPQFRTTTLASRPRTSLSRRRWRRTPTSGCTPRASASAYPRARRQAPHAGGPQDPQAGGQEERHADRHHRDGRRRVDDPRTEDRSFLPVMDAGDLGGRWFGAIDFGFFGGRA